MGIPVLTKSRESWSDSITTVVKFNNGSLHLACLNNGSGKVVLGYTSIGFEVLFTVADYSGITNLLLLSCIRKIHTDTHAQ